MPSVSFPLSSSSASAALSLASASASPSSSHPSSSNPPTSILKSSTNSNTTMGSNAAPNGHNTLYPALYLYPLNDTWAPKHIALSSLHTKIGRQTSSKTAPGEKNGFFDSKVLSRQHAEVWEENGKIYIKDVKSSNGTFINGERLSSEGHESDPFELKSDDIVEFGIDIVGEDNKTIIHHKVAARVVCVFSEQDAQVAARAEQHQQQQQLHQQQFLQQQGSAHGAGASSLGGVTGVNSQAINGLGVGGVGSNSFPQYSVQRRAQLAQQGLGAMAGMRPPGKTGLTFDVVMSRLQGELQKSRETGAELTSLSGALNEINDTLSGNVAASVPQFPSKLPPVRPPQEAPPAAPGQATSPVPAAASAAPTGALPPPPTSASAPSGSTSNVVASTSTSSPSVPSSSATTAPTTTTTTSASALIDASALTAIQSQLEATQSSLASQSDKLRSFEDALVEHEKMKREMERLRDVLVARSGVEGVPDQGGASALLKEMSLSETGSSKPHEGFDVDDDSLVLDCEGLESIMEIEGEVEAEANERERRMEEDRVEAEAQEEAGRDAHDDLIYDDDDDDDDDARSISTVMGHELERVEEEDETETETETEGGSARSIRMSRSRDGERGRMDEERGVGVGVDEGLLEGVSSKVVEETAEGEMKKVDDLEGGGEIREGAGEMRKEGAGEMRKDDDEKEKERQERKREDLGVGRPRTPEPGRHWLFGGQRRSSVGSTSASASGTASTPAISSGTTSASASAPTPSTSGTTSPPPPPSSTTITTAEELQAQIRELTVQVGAFVKLAGSLEERHVAALEVIRRLEGKVRGLEGRGGDDDDVEGVVKVEEGDVKVEEVVEEVALKDATAHKETDATTPKEKDTTMHDKEKDTTAHTNDLNETPEKAKSSSLVEAVTPLLSEWRKSVESRLCNDLSVERERLDRAREEWERKVRDVEDRVGRVEEAQRGLSVSVAGALAAATGGVGVGAFGSGAGAAGGGGGNGGGVGFGAHALGLNGDALKFVGVHGAGGLVTPPSPRSQSSDSGRYRRRRRRGGSGNHGASGSGSGNGSGEGASGSGDGSGRERSGDGSGRERSGDGSGRERSGSFGSVEFGSDDSGGEEGEGYDERRRGGDERKGKVSVVRDYEYREQGHQGQYDQRLRHRQHQRSSSSGDVDGGMTSSGEVDGGGMTSSVLSVKSNATSSSVQSAGSAAVAAMIGALPMGVGSPGVSIHVGQGLTGGVGVGGVGGGIGGDVKRVGGAVIDPSRALATPAPSDRTLEGSVDSLGDDVQEVGKDHSSSNTTTTRGGENLNVQTAVGVMLLSIAVGAVFWKIRPEA